MIVARKLSCRRNANCVCAVIAVLGTTTACQAYVPDDPWTVTASGTVASAGKPITLTWSFAPDGTQISGEGASDLIDYFDDLFNVTTSSTNLTQRPWFPLFEQSFDRWSQLGGITFVYEPNDNGSQLQSSSGIKGVRGDVRIGGAFVDGSSGTLAYTWLPNSGDVVIDTGEANFFSNPTNNYRQLRNTIMHELGHAFGLLHVESSTEELLMEPFINTSFDGPQLDDIRGIQGLYGDVYEKSNNGLGNGTYLRATTLGSLSVGGSLSLGSDAATGQSVLANETDFVSITDDADVDFFSFTISSAATLDLLLTPQGGVFNQGVEGGPQSSFNANARNDLSLAVFGPNGTSLLSLANDNGAGLTESLNDLQLSTPGQYYVRVQGATDAVQLYQLDLSLAQALNVLDGDFNDDGVVDGEDFLVWQRSSGASGTGLAADGNGDGTVNGLDLDLWEENYGQTGVLTTLVTVPEPNSVLYLAMGIVILVCRRRNRQARLEL